MPIEVLFAEDEAGVRGMTIKLIELSGAFEVVSSTGDGLQALHLFEQHRPDLCLIDLSLPGLNGLDLMRAIRSLHADARLVAYTGDESSATLRRAVNAGACAQVIKGDHPRDLIAALHAAAAGRGFFSPCYHQAIFGDFVTCHQAVGEAPRGALSPRERQVLQLIGEGYTSAQIAVKLNISPRTVDKHRSNICDKTGSSGVPDLVLQALDLGLVSQGT